MPDKKEDKSLSANPKPLDPYEMSPEVLEKILKMARRMECNEEGTILLDRNDPRDRAWYEDDEDE